MGLFGRGKNKQMQQGIADLVAQHQGQAYGVDPATIGQGDMMDMAQQASGMQAYAQRMARLNAVGVDTPGTLRALRTTGQQSGQGAEHRLDVVVRPSDRPPYDATIVQWLHPAALAGLTEGAEITLRVDPDDPTAIAFWGAAARADAPPAGEDPLDALARLGELRAQGLISEEQFAAEKARLLA